MCRVQLLTTRRRRLTLTWALSPCNDHVPRLPSTCCRPGPGYRWLISKFLSIFLVSSAQSCMPGERERESGRRRQVQGGLSLREKALQLVVTHESRFPITVLITPLFAGCRVWAIEYNARVGNLSRIAFMTAAGLSRVSQSPDMER